MSNSFSPNLNPYFGYPGAGETLSHFKKRITDAITRNNQSLLEYFEQCFKVGPDGAVFIGGCLHKLEGCSICGDYARTRGLCHYHYRQGLESGGIRVKFADPIEAFWSRVNKTETCWLWTGSKSGRRKCIYGMIH